MGDGKERGSDVAQQNLGELGWAGDDLVRSWVGEVSPTLADQAAAFVFADLYALKQLPVRYRELLIATIIATTGALPDGAVQHLNLAVREGVTPGEVDEAIAMIAAYAGFPRAIAFAREVQRQRAAR
jgi:4-carboxymuconolactone decarboxylase